MQDHQPLIAVQGAGLYPQRLEVRQNVGLNALQPGLRRFQAVRLNAEGDVLGLGQAVVAFGKLVFQHIRIFLPDAVEGVGLIRDMDRARPFLHIRPLVEERELDADRGIKIIEKIAVILKNLILVLVLRQLIVDVVELDLLGEVVVADHADTVPAHLLIGNGLLGGAGDSAVLLCLCNGSDQPPLIRAAEFGVRREPDGASCLRFLGGELSFSGFQTLCLFCLLLIFQAS